MARNSRTRDVFPISLRELIVAESFDLTPGMRRVVFTGESLTGCVINDVEMPPIVSTGFDDDMRLIFPDPATGERPWPAPLGDGRLDWNEKVTPLFRTYTVREYDEDAGRLVIDFARHGQGLAETWAANCQPGDRLWAAGPKYCASLPVHRDHLVMAGDATALPAIGRAVEELPSDAHATVFIGVASTDDIQDLSQKPHVEIYWCIAANGEDPFDALSGWQPPAGKSLYLWAAGESGRLKQVRAFAKKHGIDRADVDITGYWREATGDVESSNAVTRRLAGLADIAPGLIFGQAVRLGIFPMIDDGATTPEALAQATSIDEGRLVRLLRWLAAEDLLELTHDDAGAITAIALTSLSKELADPESKLVGRLTGAAAAGVQALMNFDEALQAGGPVRLGSTPYTMTNMLMSSTALARKKADQESTSAAWLAPAVAATIAVASTPTSRVMIAGPGAGVFADELLRRDKVSEVVIVPDQLAALYSGKKGMDPLRDVDPCRQDKVHLATASDLGETPADCALIIDPCSGEQPEDLLAKLPVDQVTIITELIEPNADIEDLEHDLIRMALTGGMTPTRLDISRRAGDAGFLVGSEQPVGWGHHAIALQKNNNQHKDQ